MKILTLYHSKSGNTKKIAEVIHEIASSNNDAVIKSLKEIKDTDLNQFDLIFLGAACHHFTSAKVMLAYIKTLPANPTYKLAGFYTHSTVHADGTGRNDYLFNEWAGQSLKSYQKIMKLSYLDSFTAKVVQVS